jgi:hypothetical protein
MAEAETAECKPLAETERTIMFTQEEKLTEIKREIALRRNVYSKRVAEGRMKREVADRQIGIMLEIAKDYGGTG